MVILFIFSIFLNNNIIKIEANEVCGCPLIDEQQKETNQLCRLARKKCTRHVAWRRLRRGEIDLKRVHQV